MKRLAHIDGLRGVAVAGVVLFHAAMWAGLQRRGISFRLFALGRPGVDLFLVISGFCLTWPLVKNGGVRRLMIADYLRWRLRRIVPPFVAALALVTLASLLAFALQSASTAGRYPRQSLFPSTWGAFGRDLVAHLTLVHGLAELPAQSFDPAFWSISLEAQFYVLFVPLALLARRSLALAIGVPVVVTLAYRLGLDPAYLRTAVGAGCSPGRWSEFAAGMAAAWFLARRRGESSGPVLPCLAGLALAGALALEFALTGRNVYLPLAWTVAGGLVVAAAGVSPGLRDLLESPPLRYLGRISYSLYLVHGSALMMVALWLGDGNGALRPAAALILGPAASLGLAVVFYHLVERHFLPASALKRVPSGAGCPGTRSTPRTASGPGPARRTTARG
jgi:peptidoglycan/LPS O-acetylase OafA/YrhL